MTDNTKITPQQKAQETRKRNAAARAEAEIKRQKEREELREKIKKNMYIILDSENATAGERLEASKMLLELERK